MRVSSALLMGLLVLTAGVTAATQEASGRWKLGGDGGCYFDATDYGRISVHLRPAAGSWAATQDAISTRPTVGPINARRSAALPRRSRPTTGNGSWAFPTSG